GRSERVVRKLRGPEPGPVPFFIKPLTRRALKNKRWPESINRFVSAGTLPFVQLIPRSPPLRAEVGVIKRFPPEFTALWIRLAPRFQFAVRRDAPYLNWKYVEAPHVRYSLAALGRRGEI